jgi:TonB family protein
LVFAAPVQVLEAVIPDWPADEPTSQSGTVTIEFLLASGGEIFVTEVERSGLSTRFEDEARLAMHEWLITDDGGGRCGLIRGRQEFRFDGAATEQVTLGKTEAWISGDATPLISMDRVEITGGRVRRATLKDQRALKEAAAIEAGYSVRRHARWKAALGGEARARFSIAGVTPPVPAVRIEPQFPRTALTTGRSGVVVSRITVDARGRAAKVEIVDSHPKAMFEQATHRALGRWEFIPAKDSAGREQILEVCQLLSYLVIHEGEFRQGGR